MAHLSKFVGYYEALSTENAEPERGDILGGLAPPTTPLTLLPSEILISFIPLGLTDIGTNPDEVGNLNDGIAFNNGGDIGDTPLNVMSEFEVIDPKVDDVGPGGEGVACNAAAAAAAACCCC